MFFWWLSTKLWLQHGLQWIHRMCNLEKLAVSCATQAHSLRQRRRGWKRDSSARYRSDNTLHPQLKCFYWPDDGTRCLFSGALQKKIASSCCYLMATNSLGALSPPGYQINLHRWWVWNLRRGRIGERRKNNKKTASLLVLLNTKQMILAQLFVIGT